MQIDIFNFLMMCALVSVVSGTLRKDKPKEIFLEIIRSFIVLSVGITIFAIFLYLLDEPSLIFSSVSGNF